MRGVSISNREEIFAVDKDAASLFNSEVTLGTLLLDVPKEFVFNAL